ncbi:putative Ni/Fe-hydrogenase B-type cytochrome subunit [bacterium BMS3Abin06]|nr:putative Ni/Fe-hydrogenase B-type cytochrome subunit [bacterium BMS3Abin06]HDZ00115.1 Ni/Fe-hydrogenase, b-type cytochrome subunit [Nitrospirota bacterium]
MLKRVYVWEFPVRWSHWILASSIAVMSITGYYIGNPFIPAASSNQYLMGWMRMIHLVAAAFFNCDILLRIYWAFAGNEYAGWKTFFPFSAQRLKELSGMLRFCLFLKKNPPAITGHDACSSLIYLLVYVLFIGQTITGFALFYLANPLFIWKLLGGWLFPLFSIQTVRLYHHFVMWVLIAFAIVHIYAVWVLDQARKDGSISSIFTGYKTIEEDED